MADKVCSTCYGRGDNDASDPEALESCGVCNGTGRILINRIPCSECIGGMEIYVNEHGGSSPRRCVSCGGVGYTED